ncbi:MAG: helix-turn-helix transcriptional regulator [Lachnospiraceae bacterium]|nr:helix-turn-helix transcriptional regulator [Lachnospiraceae bacterium]
MQDSYQLYTLATATGLQLHVISSDYSIIFPDDFSYKHDFICSCPDICRNLYDKYYGNTYLFHDIDFPDIYYACFSCESELYIIGPSYFNSTDNHLEKHFIQKYNLPRDFKLIQTTNSHLFHSLACCRYAVTGVRTSVDEILQTSSNISHNKTASEASVTRYQFERSQQDLSTPASGNDMYIYSTTYQEEELTRQYMSHYNLVMKHTDIKLHYYEAITLSQLAENAIHQGVTEPTAHSILSLYLQELEKCKIDTDIMTLHYSALDKYQSEITKAQHQHAQNKNIQSALNYLDNQVHHRFNLDDMAKSLHISKNYLCTLFKKNMGITITEYLNRRRLEGAANMLKYSDYSYSDISDYFCYSSQSRFIAAFKKYYNMTPAQYRKKL